MRQGLQSAPRLLLLKRPSPPSLTITAPPPPMHGLELNKGPLTFMLVRNKKRAFTCISSRSTTNCMYCMLSFLCHCIVVYYRLPQKRPPLPRPLYIFKRPLAIHNWYSMCRTKCTGK